MVWKKRLRTFSLLLDLQRDRLARLLQQTDGFTQRFPLQAAAVDRKNTVAYMDRTSPVNNTKTHRNIHSGFSNSKIILDKTLKKTGTELTVSGKHKYTYTQNRNENHFCRKEVKTQLMMRKIIIFKTAEGDTLHFIWHPKLIMSVTVSLHISFLQSLMLFLERWKIFSYLIFP